MCRLLVVRPETIPGFRYMTCEPDDTGHLSNPASPCSLKRPYERMTLTVQPSIMQTIVETLCAHQCITTVLRRLSFTWACSCRAILAPLHCAGNGPGEAALGSVSTKTGDAIAEYGWPRSN